MWMESSSQLFSTYYFVLVFPGACFCCCSIVEKSYSSVCSIIDITVGQSVAGTCYESSGKDLRRQNSAAD